MRAAPGLTALSYPLDRSLDMGQSQKVEPDAVAGSSAYPVRDVRLVIINASDGRAGKSVGEPIGSRFDPSKAVTGENGIWAWSGYAGRGIGTDLDNRALDGGNQVPCCFWTVSLFVVDQKSIELRFRLRTETSQS